jgi:uncharacterized delta-60 repeat protein
MLQGRRAARTAVIWVALVAAAVIFAPAAVASDGDLNTNFNGTGKLSGNLGGGSAQIFGSTMQTDGKLVVVGERDADGVVARFNPNGTLDPSFGEGTGYRVVDSGAAAGGERLRAVAIQGNKIAAVGDASISGGTDFVLARLTSDGTLDDSFDGPGGSGNGVFRVNAGVGTNAFGNAIAVSGSQLVFGGGVDAHPVIYQLTDTGTLDAGFNSTGHMTFDFPGGGGGTSFLNGLAVQPSDGKVIAVGRANSISTGMAVARITTSGALDTAAFHSPDGLVTLPPPAGYLGGYGLDVMLDPSEEILVAGFLTSSIGPPFGRDPAIAAVTPAGSLDTAGFGAGSGYAVLPLPGAFDQANAIARQPDGKLMIGGTAGDTGSTDFLAARFSPGGTLDTSFAAPAGYATTDIAGTDSTGSGLAVSGTGVAYVAGAAGINEFGIIAFKAFGPTVPTLIGTDPSSPADNNSPRVLGTADPGTTVSLFNNASCTPPAVATGSAAVFGSPGLTVSVPDNSTSTFRATASWDGGTSACSASSASYSEVTPPPINTPPATSTPTKKKCKKKKHHAAAAKKCKKKRK